MMEYQKHLKANSRKLRVSMTDAEQLLWKHIRRKQIRGLTFNRQKPIRNFVVDFYCAKAKLVIEIDGGQHFEEKHLQKDIGRDNELSKLGLLVLRFDNRQVLLETGAVLFEIDRVVSDRLRI